MICPDCGGRLPLKKRVQGRTYDRILRQCRSCRGVFGCYEVLAKSMDGLRPEQRRLVQGVLDELGRDEVQ